jgi:hypothetical protein
MAMTATQQTFVALFGDYMVFARSESYPLTDFIMAPYLGRALGDLISPPDPMGWSPDEFVDYACCL